ncbi:MAG: imidazole glycerol phosphate synthase subunit HisH [candidate division Zixibacteria bacterium]|nr:imidazole glycerol phosphate synthase subunit HisH [candidate division Zixibacteria bacterium]
MKKICIVDYDAGNQTSVKRALDHLGIVSVITADPDAVRHAELIIFPGVGHAGSAMQVLKARGLDAALIDAFRRGTPLLGICVGCQILLSRSEESDTACLGFIEGVCRRFRPTDRALKVPHMGWNAVEVARPHPVLKDLVSGDEVYFVHSYYPAPADERRVFAVCDYGGDFAAMIGYRNLFAMQFHVEKSGPVGLNLLKNFSEWDGVYAE